jgi:hypothetical protein
VDNLEPYVTMESTDDGVDIGMLWSCKNYLLYVPTLLFYYYLFIIF